MINFNDLKIVYNQLFIIQQSMITHKAFRP
jgi:hypothetical protein